MDIVHREFLKFTHIIKAVIYWDHKDRSKVVLLFAQYTNGVGMYTNKDVFGLFPSIHGFTYRTCRMELAIL